MRETSTRTATVQHTVWDTGPLSMLGQTPQYDRRDLDLLCWVSLTQDPPPEMNSQGRGAQMKYLFFYFVYFPSSCSAYRSIRRH
jgi:hypothetical protein